MFVSLGCRKIVRRAAPKGLKKSDVVWALEKVVLSVVPYHSSPRFPPAVFLPDLPPGPACGGSPPTPPHCSCRSPPKARGGTSSRSTGESCEIDRDGTHAGKLSQLYSTLPFSIFYTPLPFFYIVLCNTHY